MKVLVIPDVHLKPTMFDMAKKIMQKYHVEQAVCLMDIADDWNQQLNLDLYINSYDAAVEFAKMFPASLWCYGNHELCYMWNKHESGYSGLAAMVVNSKINELRNSLIDLKQMAYVHRIDNVIFSHSGLSDMFANIIMDDHPLNGSNKYDVDILINTINALGCEEMWDDLSPIWYRPQRSKMKIYGEGKYLQVVGHTPVKMIVKKGNILSCDVFSSYPDGTPVGEQKYIIIDTVTCQYQKIICE